MDFRYKTLGFDKIYVINLKRRQDRKDQLLKDNPGINFTFIEAIDGKDLKIEDLQKEGKLHTSFYDPTGMVTLNIFACALSHKKAWDQALADGVENALILEDDIHFFTPFVDIKNKSLTPVYRNILSSIKSHDWDILHLGKKNSHVQGIKLNEFFVIPKYRQTYDGAHAYAVTRKMLQTLSDNCLPVKYAADVYLEEYIKTHNVFVLKQSLVRQHSDFLNSSNSDSDTYYNDYRIGGGKVGISFDENGNVLNKQIAKYVVHPKDSSREYVGTMIGKPKFGVQHFLPKDKYNTSFFGMCKMLSFLSENLDGNLKMIEINPHFGETTFFFGTSGIFSNIFAIDPLRGEDQFNLDNNLTWEEIKIGFYSNTYFFKNVSYINQFPKEVVGSFKDISFIYIHDRGNQDIKSLINLYLPTLKSNSYIGGKGLIGIDNKIEFEDGSWLVKKEHYEF